MLLVVVIVVLAVIVVGEVVGTKESLVVPFDSQVDDGPTFTRVNTGTFEVCPECGQRWEICADWVDGGWVIDDICPNCGGLQDDLQEDDFGDDFEDQEAFLFDDYAHQFEYSSREYDEHWLEYLASLGASDYECVPLSWDDEWLEYRKYSDLQRELPESFFFGGEMFDYLFSLNGEEVYRDYDGFFTIARIVAREKNLALVTVADLVENRGITTKPAKRSGWTTDELRKDPMRDRSDSRIRKEGKIERVKPAHRTYS